MEKLKFLEFWNKWKIETWENGIFWTVWYHNGTIMVPYGTIWYLMVPCGTIKIIEIFFSV